MTTGLRHVAVLHRPVSAVVEVPGSKSVANRALVCAALAHGESVLVGVPDGDDTAAMLDCLGLLGASIGQRASSSGIDVVVGGTTGAVGTTPCTLSTRLAGTTSRFVTAMAALGTAAITVDGLPPLRSRPMTPLHDALSALGVTIDPGESWGHLPVTIVGPATTATDGAVPTVQIRGDVSSQFVTALMLIAPYLPNGLRIELTSSLVSRSYLTITSAVMEAFGVGGVTIDETAVVVPSGRYGSTTFVVEPDATSAGYPLAAAAIVGGTLHVPDLTAASLQGDARFAGVLEEMGCEVIRDDGGTTLTRSGALRGIDIDMNDLSDLVPTLAAVAPFANTPTTIRGVGFIRAKESDRIGDLCRELERCKVDVTETADGLIVRPGLPAPAAFATYHDHRLAMALALIGLRVDGVSIIDPGVVRKSWPGYWDMLEGLR